MNFQTFVGDIDPKISALINFYTRKKYRKASQGFPILLKGWPFSFHLHWVVKE